MNPHVGALSWQAAEGAPQCLSTQRRARTPHEARTMRPATLLSGQPSPRAPRRCEAWAAPPRPRLQLRRPSHARRPGPSRARRPNPCRGPPRPVAPAPHLKTRARAHAAAGAQRAVVVRADSIRALDAPDAPPDLRAHDAGADAGDALPDDETDAVLQRGVDALPWNRCSKAPTRPWRTPTTTTATATRPMSAPSISSRLMNSTARRALLVVRPVALRRLRRRRAVPDLSRGPRDDGGVRISGVQLPRLREPQEGGARLRPARTYYDTALTL